MKHINFIILTNENRPTHRQSVMIYLPRSKAVFRVDADLSQHKKKGITREMYLNRIIYHEISVMS